ncbi:Ankyrin-2 [Arthrobotrys entomopaga]|nr:Ankyrin-2 [Arthrobotrys entomopaga]
MKFAENYQHHQIPGWTQSYCNYDKLKGVLRQLRQSTSSEEATEFGESFQSHVKDEIDIVEKTVSSRLASLRLRIAKSWSLYGISPELEKRGFSTTISDMNYKETSHLFSESCEQYEAVQYLQHFAKVNALAFSRILEKTRGISEEAYQSVQRKLVGCSFFHQKDILSQVHQLKSRIEGLEAARKSLVGLANGFLLLNNICADQKSKFSDLQELRTAIYEDRPEKIIVSLNQHIDGTRLFPWDFQKYTDRLVRSAIFCDSFHVACELIVFIGSKSKYLKFDSILIHELIQKLGKHKKEENSTNSAINDPFIAMFDQIYPDQRASFTTVDELGRIPLHYAAEYGLLVEYQTILAKMEQWGYFNGGERNYLLLQDSDGSTPLDLAVLNGNNEIVDATLQFRAKSGDNLDTNRSEAIAEILQSNLLVAVTRNDDRISHLLLKNGVDCGKCWKNNESPLYIAARLGYTDIVVTLTANLSGEGVKLDEAETVYGWTPLMVACARGFDEIVKLLVEAGADQQRLDFRGLSAKEIAVFRGHIQLSGHLKDQEVSSKVAPEKIQRLLPSYSQNLRDALNDGKNILLVNPGTLDLTKQVTPVNFTAIKASTSYPVSIYNVEVSLIDSEDTSYSLPLPLLEDLTNKPWSFVTQDVHDLKLGFKVFRATETLLEKGELVGSSIAILNNMEPKLGPGIDSIIRETTIPIQEKDTLRYMGTITFTYVIVTAPPHARMNTTPSRNAWKDIGSVTVVGHRGENL